MAHTRKKHHYIPQFYLRKFSVESNGKTIGVYNHEIPIFIRQAAIKHQASIKYLYGEDDIIEEALSEMESHSAQVIDILIKHLYPPPENSNAADRLKQFILFQISRTIKAGEKIMESANSTFQAVFREHKDYDSEKHGDFRLANDNPVLLSLQYTDQFLPLIRDLTCKTLINLTEIPFITSDNPVIKYNQWMESKKLYAGSTGLGVKGLQLFFPIHPRLMLCWYDKTVYKYGDKKELILKTESLEDIRQINAMQYLFSRSQLFFNEILTEKYFIDLVKAYRSRRAGPSHITRKTDPVTDKSGEIKSLLLNLFQDPSIDLQLSFVKFQKRANKIQLPGGLPVVRKESFKDIKFDLD